MKHDQVLALVRAHVDGDSERFRATALAIAANEEPKSGRFAKSMRNLAERTPRVQQMTALPHQVESLLAPCVPATVLDDVVLETATRARFDRFLTEQRARDRLLEHELSPMRKLLFVGPPGVGKTMMASALANELQLPLLRVQLHGVIASHLGETAGHLSKVFANIRAMRGVYLFDEFDALSPQRTGDGRDVGEMRRVVNSLLQFIELDESDSIIIGTTNYADVIDSAMFRRFDDVIEFPLPSPDVSRRLIESHLLFTDDGIDWPAICAASSGIGHADLASACHRVNKDAVLGDRTSISTDEVVAAIRGRFRPETEAVA